ncbi:hypothetical protein NPIL_624231, partial [Nephila pilipes]
QLIAKIAEQHRQRCLDRHAASSSTSTADGGAGDAAVLVAAKSEASLGRTSVSAHRYRCDDLNPSANQVIQNRTY